MHAPEVYPLAALGAVDCAVPRPQLAREVLVQLDEVGHELEHLARRAAVVRGVEDALALHEGAPEGVVPRGEALAVLAGSREADGQRLALAQLVLGEVQLHLVALGGDEPDAVALEECHRLRAVAVVVGSYVLEGWRLATVALHQLTASKHEKAPPEARFFETSACAYMVLVL